MFCPSCGTQISNDQKYCRSCGMELEPVAALVAGRSAPSPSFKRGNSDQEITFRAVKLIGAGGLLFFLGALLAATGQQRDNVTTLGMLLLIFGVMIAVFGLFQGVWAKTKPRPAAVQTDANTQPELKAPLAASIAPAIPSITESTTRLMDEDASPPFGHSIGHCEDSGARAE